MELLFSEEIILFNVGDRKSKPALFPMHLLTNNSLKLYYYEDLGLFGHDQSKNNFRNIIIATIKKFTINSTV